MTNTTGKINLLGLTQSEMEQFFESIGEKRFRAGQVMKKGTLLCCGNANFMTGYMMYGGRMIILGESGERLGEDMSGGEIFLGGKLNSLGSDAELTDMDSAEADEIMEFLDRYENAGPEAQFCVQSPSHMCHTRDLHAASLHDHVVPMLLFPVRPEVGVPPRGTAS